MNKFNELYKVLNKEQKETVDAIEGPVMVVAGPGTGKTQILTLRIANILNKADVRPENILAITFTESGVASMRKRLAEIIGTTAYRVAIKTFHGFCNDIIKNYPEEFPRIIGSKQISEIDQIAVLEELVDKAPAGKGLSFGASSRRVLEEPGLDLLRPFGDRFLYVKDILSSINELKREGIGPEEFINIVEKEKNNFKQIPDIYHEKGAHKGKMKGEYQKLEKQINKNNELSIIYEAYEKVLTEKKLYDYSDMIMEALKTMRRNENLLLQLQEECQYVLVDEHQDTNNAQNKIIELLMNYHDNPNIFVVGDEKQAIFRFQGASLENFLYFKNLYPKAKLILLVENYRSTQTILDSAHSLLSGGLSLAAQHGGTVPASHNEDSIKLRSNVNYDEKPIHLAAFSSQDAEHFFLAQDIKIKISGKRSKSGKTPGVGASLTPGVEEDFDLGELIEPDKIAVLYRDNKDAFPIARMLEKFNIPYTIESDQDLFSDSDVRKIIILLRAINNYGEDEYLAAALHLDFFGLVPLDVYKLIRQSKDEKIPLYDLIASGKRSKSGKTPGVKGSPRPRGSRRIFTLRSWEKNSPTGPDSPKMKIY
ncbi:MAG: UvrD/REP helicase [Candidatus Nomurabacteria bacterium GW2011_GWB1_37_5]|uniref:DNA 3'-5' helicase n=1 Tax=Candidatus Nomurabacteria bacterium GW2011_GWB1_37_5 TaxID=1618742 RepID=A0A0G0GXI0_9BACT|nr:MAG: UvrD/REP helicase [Candidatus Nomurabacteria bacterium GW2011_GWB1_37_5]